MDLERKSAGRLHFALGPVEKWVVSSGAALLVVLLGLVYSGITSKIDSQQKGQERTNDTMQQVVRQQAVTNSQLASINLQLANVPGLTERVSRVEVRVESLEEGQRELRGLRGAR